MSSDIYAPPARIAMSKAAFARAFDLGNPEDARRLVSAGVIPDVTVDSLAALQGSLAGKRITRTPEPVAVIRLGSRDGALTATSRAVGWREGLSASEVEDAALRWWRRSTPWRGVLDLGVLHVSFASIVVGVCRIFAEEPTFDSDGRLSFHGELLAHLDHVVGGSITYSIPESSYTQSEAAAVGRIGRRLLTGRGAPLVLRHPVAD